MKKMKDDLTKTIEIEDSYLNEVLSSKLIEKEERSEKIPATECVVIWRRR